MLPRPVQPGAPQLWRGDLGVRGAPAVCGAATEGPLVVPRAAAEQSVVWSCET